MQDSPTSPEALEAIISLLEDRIIPKVSGHDSYALRVAINSLRIVQREIEIRPQAEIEEHARLRELLGHEGALSDLNEELCEKIREGVFTLRDKSVLDHLRKTAIDQVRIDQPRYSGLRYALEQDEECPKNPPAH